MIDRIIKIKKHLKITSIILIISISLFTYYIYYSLKDKPYDELYLTATQNSNFEGYLKLPNIIYKIYVNNFRGHKQDLLSLYPDPITCFINADDDTKTKKQNIEKVLSKGISINMIGSDYSKRTPIYNAIILQEEEIMHFLVDKGADLTVKDYKGRTPLELAKFLLKVSQQRLDTQGDMQKEWAIKELMTRKNIVEYLEEKQKANNLK